MSNNGIRRRFYGRLMVYVLCMWSPLGQSAHIEVKLENPPATGILTLMLFDSANAFGDFRDPAKRVKHSVDGREVYRIKNVPPGQYALLVYHDENENDRIDKNFMGIPKEPLGFSNRYRPKGPPRYSRAAFSLTEGEPKHFDVELHRPLGKRGRVGFGIGVIARSNPYRGSHGEVYQIIPALTYIGKRFQVLGPNLQFGLVGSGKLRLAAIGSYRIGVYEEDESDVLQGMGDREDTFMTGLALQVDVPGGIDFSASYSHDILDVIGGGEGRLEFGKSFQFGIFKYTPTVRLNWTSSELANHDFGVPTGKAKPNRPAYTLDDTISVEGGLSLFVELTRDWSIMLNGSLERFDQEVTDSPIVGKDYVSKGFASISYLF